MKSPNLIKHIRIAATEVTPEAKRRQEHAVTYLPET